MKAWLISILLPFILFGAGCSRTVNVADLSNRLAPAVGVDADSFQFLSYCGISEPLNGASGQRIRLDPGIVALTNNHLVIAKGAKASNIRSENLTSIPLDEITGISRKDSQLILLHGGVELLIVVADGTAKPNEEKAFDLFGMLVLAGVSDYKSDALLATNWDLYWNMFVEGPKFRWGLPQNGGTDNIRY